MVVARKRGAKRFCFRKVGKEKARGGTAGFCVSVRLARRSVPDGDAGNVGTLQCAAGRFSGVLIEAGEAGAIERLAAFGHDLGELFGIAEQLAGAAACGAETLAGFTFGFKRAEPE